MLSGTMWALIILLANKPTQIGKCGGEERWSVKTLSDPGGAYLQHPPEPATIGELSSLPSEYQPHGSRQKGETRIVEIDAFVVGFKLEADGDYHVVISDGRQTMVIELPDPRCVQSKQYQPTLAYARRSFLAILPNGVKVEPAFKKLVLKSPLRVKVTGVVFFDRIHGQNGVAKNGVELHPVLLIDLQK